MKWILLIYLSGGYGGNSPAATSAEFGTKAACQAAFSALYAELNKRKPYPDSNRTPEIMRGVCVPKGTL